MDDAGCVGLGELELDFGIETPVLAEHGGQWSQHGGADESDTEEAEVAVADAAGFSEVFVDVAEGAPGALEEDFAGGCELDCARCAEEERVAEDLFELADLLREWGLSEVESAGGASEVELFGDGDEVAEMAEFYVAIIHI